MGNEYIVLVIGTHAYYLHDRLFTRPSENVVILTDADVPDGSDPLIEAAKRVVEDTRAEDQAAIASGAQKDPEYGGFSIIELRILQNGKIFNRPTQGSGVNVLAQTQREGNA